ncbi:hypothetical protein [Absidia glauca]|uniref:Uncharacterized protein n=1 Tax=Absidia glauca TaxID=4829 RepID=A0A168R786_ABSGL|nr:hypothetical protein [Absidia glauca]
MEIDNPSSKFTGNTMHCVAINGYQETCIWMFNGNISKSTGERGHWTKAADHVDDMAEIMHADCEGSSFQVFAVDTPDKVRNDQSGCNKEEEIQPIHGPRGLVPDNVVPVAMEERKRNVGLGGQHVFTDFCYVDDADVEGKFCTRYFWVWQSIWSFIWCKTKQLDRLTAGLRRYEDSTGFSRTFRRKLNHCGSFLGRDFKQHVQCLPLVIAYDFTLDTDDDIQAVGKLFDALGHLSSLVFVKAVKAVPFNLDMYLSTLKAAVIKMTTKLYDYDIQHPQFSPLSTKLKTHILLHLVDDIRRHKPQSGHEAIYHTNRQAPSRDLATIFGKRTMLRHIIEGGSWTDISTNNTVKCGSAITAFLDRNNKFLEVFLDGSREFEDNNNVSIDIRPDCYAVFSKVDNNNTKAYFLGKTAKSKSMDVTRYINHGKDSRGYIAPSPSRSCYSLADLKVECLLDTVCIGSMAKEEAL